MNYFNMIYDECVRINSAIERRYTTFYFLESSLHQIVYQNEGDTLTFGYYPERYECGKTMDLKGLMISTRNMSMAYSVVHIVSFFKNNCAFFEEDNTKYCIDTLLDYYDFFRLNAKKNVDWEAKLQTYLDKTYPW